MVCCILIHTYHIYNCSDQGAFKSFVGGVQDRISDGGNDESSTGDSDVMGGLSTTLNNLSWQQDPRTTKVCLYI